MPYYTDGGVYQNQTYFHFKHLFSKDSNTHSAIPIRDVVVKGIFSDTYAKSDEDEENQDSFSDIDNDSEERLYAYDPADEKISVSDMEYMVTSVYEKFQNVDNTCLITSFEISPPPRLSSAPMRTCMAFSSMNDKGMDVVQAFKGAFNVHEIEARARDFGVVFEQ